MEILLLVRCQQYCVIEVYYCYCYCYVQVVVVEVYVVVDCYLYYYDVDLGQGFVYLYYVGSDQVIVGEYVQYVLGIGMCWLLQQLVEQQQ